MLVVQEKRLLPIATLDHMDGARCSANGDGDINGREGVGSSRGWGVDR
jgi:hypothetical protein